MSSVMSLLCVYKNIRTYQEHHIGGLIKSSGHTDPLLLASGKNNTLEREMNDKRLQERLYNKLVKQIEGVKVWSIAVHCGQEPPILTGSDHFD